MKKKLFALLLCAATLLLTVCSLSVSAYEPYVTYTYDSQGDVLYSPAAYTPIQAIDSAYMKQNARCTTFKDIAEPTDLFAASDGRVFIVDRKNSQVVVLDKYYRAVACLDVFDSSARDNDSFNGCTGLFVDADTIYVCDTQNARIVTFWAHDVYEEGVKVHSEYEFRKIIEKPRSALIDEDALFLPIAIAVDQYKRLFVLSSSSYEGVIVMDEDSHFTGYIGAPKVTYSAFQMMWRELQSPEQRANELPYLPTQFQNITVDADGFIYVTSSTIDEGKQRATLTQNGTKSASDYAPVRKLNSTGAEIMKRNGFFDCGGEVVGMFNNTGVSKLVDVAIGPEGSWSVIDSRRSRVYTYDSNGVLLFAFGEGGSQLGNITSLNAITYQPIRSRDVDTGIETTDYLMLLLDYASASFTVYRRTSYGDKLINALKNDNDRRYDQSILYWQEVRQYNNNFDAAYIGVGKSLYASGNYTEAMEYLEAAKETTNWSKAYSEIRKDWISRFVLLLILIIALLIFAIVRLFKYAAKVNQKAVFKVGRKSYWEELMFAFHLMFHPFDGFWDLKHEKRGSVRGATTIMVLVIVAFYYQSIGRGYLLNPEGRYTGILMQVFSITLPVLLFAVSNWCLTTLFNGEGSFRDVYISTCYSLSPIPLILVLSTVFSNFVTETGTGFITFVNAVAFVWAGLLLLLGVMVTHDYTFAKNILTLIGTVVSMCVILFVVLLFSSLIGRIVEFISSIAVELTYRT
ncbi:MAG: YIP1 family protein [Clostridia bacterium]|nr:YIP1 family protein [Clostridia bacterium]